MRQLIKRILYCYVPRWTTAVMSARARAHSHRLVESWGCGLIQRKLIERFGSRVKAGPFAGMELTPMTHAEQIGPYLLGVYESELDAAWDIVLRGSYSQIIDIGSKFGYYAVALARKYPKAEVVSFDTDWWARKATREMTAANHTSNVQIETFCSPEWLAKHTRSDAFIISDCEGYEEVLFGASVVSKLSSATLIIETHDCSVPGVSNKLRAAFGESHEVSVYGLEESRRGPALNLDFLSESEQKLAVQEVRPAQIWLLCLPKTGPNSSLHQTAV